MNTNSKFSSWEDAVSWLRAQPDQKQLVKDCYYDDPLIDAADRYWRSEEWKAVKELLAGRSGKALDVGAGRGIASYSLAKEGFSVSALEPDDSPLVGAKAISTLSQLSNLPIAVTQEFSERLPFADETFDVVFARAVLHHTRDINATCFEFFRVLKPGGLLIAIREHVISHTADLPRFLELHPLHRLYGGEHAYVLSQYNNALRQSGFENTTVISPWHSTLNFAPHTLTTLRAEVAKRISLGIPIIEKTIRALLNAPGVWPIARIILNCTDRRPGRLYSFIASKS